MLVYQRVLIHETFCNAHLGIIFREIAVRVTGFSSHQNHPAMMGLAAQRGFT